jgi:hypothetical protein
MTIKIYMRDGTEDMLMNVGSSFELHQGIFSTTDALGNQISYDDVERIVVVEDDDE